ncbi:hypothetical protein [Jeotgalibaca porci]|uniref:hypothetical protein n=1 Tax=Jeotgalibaca porci TaxID=1868793 RepID=UPI00359F83E0
MLLITKAITTISAISVAPLVNWMLMTTNRIAIGRVLMLKKEVQDEKSSSNRI